MKLQKKLEFELEVKGCRTIKKLEISHHFNTSSEKAFELTDANHYTTYIYLKIVGQESGQQVLVFYQNLFIKNFTNDILFYQIAPLNGNVKLAKSNP